MINFLDNIVVKINFFDDYVESGGKRRGFLV